MHALADRELVVLVKEPGGWAGVGEYGPLRDRDTGYWDDESNTVVSYGPEVPTAHVRTIWCDDFDDDGNPLRVKLNIEQVHAGMPTGIALFVWTPAAAADRQRRLEKFREAVAAGR